ncbi:MAG: hypothetical protein QNK23_11370 [Crocinitomicaceae bacterium]|nr:hypothetical protein [Crocinitomicaceae bacterium]
MKKPYILLFGILLSACGGPDHEKFEETEITESDANKPDFDQEYEDYISSDGFLLAEEKCNILTTISRKVMYWEIIPITPDSNDVKRYMNTEGKTNTILLNAEFFMDGDDVEGFYWEPGMRSARKIFNGKEAYVKSFYYNKNYNDYYSTRLRDDKLVLNKMAYVEYAVILKTTFAEVDVIDTRSNSGMQFFDDGTIAGIVYLYDIKAEQFIGCAELTAHNSDRPGTSLEQDILLQYEWHINQALKKEFNINDADLYMDLEDVF